MNKDDYRYKRWQAETANALVWRKRLDQCPEGEAFDELRNMYRMLAEEREAWGLEYWVAMVNESDNAGPER